MSRAEGPVRVAMSVLSQGAFQRTGAWVYARELMRRLGNRPDSVRLEVLVNEHGWRELAGTLPESVSICQARNFRVGAGKARRLCSLGRAQLAPHRLSGKMADDVELVHYPLTLNVPRVNRPRVMTLHDMQHHDLSHAFSPAQRRWRAIMYDRAARNARFVVTDSEHARCRIMEIVGVPPERIATVHLGVDQSHFSSNATPADARALMSLGLASGFLYYPAALWAHKNHAQLLAALARSDVGDLMLVCTGPTFGGLDRFLSVAATHGLQDRVRHLGLVADETIPALYRAAAAVVFPSSYEGFGLPPLEAMACGCPVASSLRGSLEEVCGTAALPLEPDDIDQMAHAIERIVSDETLRSDLRRSGFEQASRFSWDRSADQLIAAYEAALSDDVARTVLH